MIKSYNKYHNGLYYSYAIVILSLIDFIINFFEIQSALPIVFIAINDLLFLYLSVIIIFLIKNILVKDYYHNKFDVKFSPLIVLYIVQGLLSSINRFINNSILDDIIFALLSIVVVLIIIVTIKIWRINPIEIPNIVNIRRFIISYFLVSIIFVTAILINIYRNYTLEVAVHNVDYFGNIVNAIPFIFLMKFFKSENERAI